MMKKVLGDFVLVRRTGDDDGDFCAGVVLFEEGNQRFQKHRLESRAGVRDVRLHLKLSLQADSAISKVESAAEPSGDPGHIEHHPVGRHDAVLHPGAAAKG